MLWNIHYDWPFLQLMRAIRAEGRDVVLGTVDFFLQQVLSVDPLVAPVWLTGLFALLFSKGLRPYRFVGLSYLVCYAAFFLLHGKTYYLTPLYPVLIAAGAVVVAWAFDSWINGRARISWVKPATVALLVINGLYFSPIVVPILSPDNFLEYAKHLPFNLPVMEHSHARVALPQWYSDQFGFKEIADEAEVAWNRIPAGERADCGIFGQDYGQAGAVDFFGRAHGLPGALSGDRTYFLWGPGHYSGNCMVVIDDDRETLERLWEQVEYIGTSARNSYALEMPVDVFICKGKKFDSWAGFWPKVKRWR